MIYGTSSICDKPHHLWCNFFSREEQSCNMCDRFYKEYPYTSVEDLIERSKIEWPENIIRGTNVNPAI
jgi:hypothetical protein